MTIREREEQIRRLPIEYAIAWNAEGVEILTKSGEKDRIVFTDDELSALHGTVFTHNHPSGLSFPDNDPRSFGNSFSLADFRLACYLSLIEMRVVTLKLRFSLRPSASGWSENYWQSTLEPIYLKHKAGVTYEIKAAMKSSRMSQPDAEALHFHEICRRTSEEAGLDYQREES